MVATIVASRSLQSSDPPPNDPGLDVITKVRLRVRLPLQATGAEGLGPRCGRRHSSSLPGRLLSATWQPPSKPGPGRLPRLGPGRGIEETEGLPGGTDGGSDGPDTRTDARGRVDRRRVRGR